MSKDKSSAKERDGVDETIIFSSHLSLSSDSTVLRTLLNLLAWLCVSNFRSVKHLVTDEQLYMAALLTLLLANTTFSYYLASLLHIAFPINRKIISVKSMRARKSHPSDLGPF